MKVGDKTVICDSGYSRPATCVECHGCGKLVFKPDIRLQRQKKHFCSIDCYLDWQKKNRIYIFKSEKKCPKCGEIKAADCFSSNSTKSDRMGYMCKDCHSVYISGHYIRNKEKYKSRIIARIHRIRESLMKIKRSLSCCKCGESDAACLDFHHRDASKKEMNLACAANRGWCEDRILKEIEKCDILCANCHRELHAELRSCCYVSSNVKQKTEQKKMALVYLGNKCSKCGYDKSIFSLAFHHIDPKTKEFQICSCCRSWETLKPELDKCIVLCTNCHRKLHSEERLVG